MPLTPAPLPESNQSALPPGTIIGDKYRIDGFLGAGGMGVVLSATHLQLDSPVAIKIVRDDLAQNEEVVSRLLFEARAAARMRSTHIVRVLDVARLETGAPYIVMEQLQGADLATLLAERGALSVPEAVRYVLQACEGLAEAHQLGIIHRDLKPENLFLANTPEGVVLKILDFGISKDIGTSAAPRRSRTTLSKAGSAVGSPYYMSPEQMRAAPDLDARSDIWSLGAILFELVTGQCPFEGETPALICSKVMIDEAPSLREFSNSAPERLDIIVRRCLEKQPSARFQTVTELADALRDFAVAEERASADPQRLASGIDLKTHSDAEPAVAPLRSGEGEYAPASGQRRTLLALLAVSTLLVAAGAVFWRLQHHPELLPWLSGHAGAAEAARQSPPNSGSDDAEPKPASLAPASEARPSAVITPEAAALPGVPPNLRATEPSPRDQALAPRAQVPAPRAPVPAPRAPAPAPRAPAPLPRTAAPSSSPWVIPAPPPAMPLPPPIVVPPLPAVETPAASQDRGHAPPSSNSDANNPAARYGL